jgi:hypothetical protein
VTAEPGRNFSIYNRDNRLMPTEPPPPPAPKPPRVHVTPEDLERFGDEDLMRRASNDDWLRDETPPHHGQ